MLNDVPKAILVRYLASAFCLPGRLLAHGLYLQKLLEAEGAIPARSHSSVFAGPGLK